MACPGGRAGGFRSRDAGGGAEGGKSGHDAGVDERHVVQAGVREGRTSEDDGEAAERPQGDKAR